MTRIDNSPRSGTRAEPNPGGFLLLDVLHGHSFVATNTWYGAEHEEAEPDAVHPQSRSTSPTPVATGYRRDVVTLADGPWRSRWGRGGVVAMYDSGPPRVRDATVTPTDVAHLVVIGILAMIGSVLVSGVVAFVAAGALCFRVFRNYG
jgi:hypothetical protein